MISRMLSQYADFMINLRTFCVLNGRYYILCRVIIFHVYVFYDERGGCQINPLLLLVIIDDFKLLRTLKIIYYLGPMPYIFLGPVNKNTQTNQVLRVLSSDLLQIQKLGFERFLITH